MHSFVLWFVENGIRRFVYSDDRTAMQMIGDQLAKRADITEIELRGQIVEPGKLFHKWGE